MAIAPRPSLTQTNGPGMDDARLQAQEVEAPRPRRSLSVRTTVSIQTAVQQENPTVAQAPESPLRPPNEASTVQIPARMNLTGMQGSQFLDSAFDPPASGSATYPVADSRTRNDSGVQASQFLSDSPPSDWGHLQQAAPAPQPRRTSRAAPQPVYEPSSESQPDGSTTYAQSSSDNSTVQQRQSQYQPWGDPTAMGQGAQNQQEWQRHMRMWSASVASERRASTADSDTTNR
ncbi:hypothetical protein FB451DRAFT_1242371 [Mycena latifolia]|nr:hypothetical protein FB451DRAFT_1242371 [Mycena latifolia]